MAAADPDRLVVRVTNTDATNPVYIGGANVSATSGDKLKAGDSLLLTGAAAVAPLSAIASGGTVVVSVLAIDQ